MRNKKILFCVTIPAIILLSLIIAYSISRFQLTTVSNTSRNSENTEPITPVNIDDPPFSALTLPENEVPIKTVMSRGKEIPVDFIYNNPNWQRQAYKDYWHSSYSRWSYVPNRIHYAMHKVFATYPTASIYYDFRHNLGIAEEILDFRQYITSSMSPYKYLEVVIMNTSIEKIYTYENQVVIVGKPQRYGLQAIIIPVDEIKPIKNSIGEIHATLLLFFSRISLLIKIIYFN